MDPRFYFLKAIEHGRVEKAQTIVNRFGANKTYSSNDETIVFVALKRDIKTLTYILSLGFKLHYEHLREILKRTQTSESLDLLLFTLRSGHMIYPQNKPAYFKNPLCNCRTSEQIKLLLEYIPDHLKNLTFDDIYRSHYIYSSNDVLYDLRNIYNFYEEDKSGNTILHFLNLNCPAHKKIILCYPNLNLRNRKGRSIFQGIANNTTFNSKVIDFLYENKETLIFDVNECNLIYSVFNRQNQNSQASLEDAKKIIDLGADIYEPFRGKKVIDFVPEQFKQELIEYAFIPEIKGAL